MAIPSPVRARPSRTPRLRPLPADAGALPARPTGAHPILVSLSSHIAQLSSPTTALVLVSLVAHGLNLFDSPAFIGDEGIYTSQAWAVLREQRLSPYTYVYDHAPAGWIMLAAWLGVTGGPHTFGLAIDSGRILMLLLHVAMVPMLYHVARKLMAPHAPDGLAQGAACLGVLLFSVSPLAVFYQRLVLLDTFMLFWVLLSLDLLLDGWGRLSRVSLSGACFGIALLSKETAVFLVPAMIYIAIQQRWRHQGRYAVLGWLVPMLVVASWYPLFALFKDELFPSGRVAQFFNSGYAVSNVSLLGALQWQLSRSGGGPFNLHNQFWTLLRDDWLPRDAFLLAGGALATALNLARGLRDRRAMAAGLLGALPLAYLARGGPVFSYYVLFAIPFLCLNLAVAGLSCGLWVGKRVTMKPLEGALSRLTTYYAPLAAALAVATLGVGYWKAGLLQPLYTERPGQAEREALAWIKRYLPPESRIITRDDPWTDLHEPGLGGPAFPNAHSHWKVAADPEIRGGVFHDDWRMVDYLIMTPDLTADLEGSHNAVALDALAHAHLIKSWSGSTSNPRLYPRQIVELWKVDKTGQTDVMLLNGSAAYMAQRFEREGAFVAADGSVTSEAQAYALLRALWSSDEAAFRRSWRWARDHLQRRDGLLAWLWRDGRVVDSHTAADADVDMAFALLLASRRWGDPSLAQEGTRMVQAIWQREVVVINGAPYLVAGDWAAEGGVVALNPSYFAPYAFRIFHDVDPGHDWFSLLDSSYRTLFAVEASPLDSGRSAGLPPDWVGLDRATGQFVPLKLARTETTRYGYDAARTYWRLALDLRWFADDRARTLLHQASFLRDEMARKGHVSAVYAHNGSVVQESPSMVGTVGALSALLTLDAGMASALYSQQVVGAATYDSDWPFWGAADDLYSQEWAWLGIALYTDRVQNLWKADD